MSVLWLAVYLTDLFYMWYNYNPWSPGSAFIKPDQRNPWIKDQAYNFTPTVTKFCVMWEGLSLPHDTKFGNCRCKIVDSRSFHSWSLIHGLRWSGLIKVGPDVSHTISISKGQRCKSHRPVGSFDHIHSVSLPIWLIDMWPRNKS